MAKGGNLKYRVLATDINNLRRNWMKQETKASLCVGMIGVFVGTLLTICWDLYKTNVADERTRIVLLMAIKNDLVINTQIIPRNQIFLKTEIAKLRTTGEKVVDPLLPLKSGFFELLKINSVSCFSKKPDVLLKLRDLEINIDYFNTTIQNREHYGINQVNYQKQLIIYDEILMRLSKDLITDIGDLNGKLN